MTTTSDITLTDMFCGAGGTTTGAVAAGVNVRLAINHWQRAIETHNTNHPQTTHILTDLHKANPRRFRRTTGIAASPECTNHSIAKGRRRLDGQLALWDEGLGLAAEAEERSRCTMWTPLDWAECHDYQFVLLENVVDAHLWRPFQSWLHAWQSLDYEFELVFFNSMHAHPTPQSRDRMYFVAWKRGNRRPNLKITPLAYCNKCEKDVEAAQVWKNPDRQWGKYRQQYIYCCPHCVTKEVVPYYYAAANAIDWSLPAPRIGDRKKPLKEKTMERIAYGLAKFAHTQTLLLHTSHSECGHTSYVGAAHHIPFPTQTTRQDLAVAVPPFLLNLNHPEARPVAVADQPFPTQTAYDSTGLTVPPFILDHLGEYRPRAITGPVSTICASGNHHSLVVPPSQQQQSWLMTYYNHGQLASIEEAVPTVTTLARHALVTRDVQANTQAVAIDDCGFRMLMPKEIQAAMAFPDDYVVTGTRREQVKQLGNAVTPPVVELLMRRLIASLQ